MPKTSRRVLSTAAAALFSLCYSSSPNLISVTLWVLLVNYAEDTSKSTNVSLPFFCVTFSDTRLCVQLNSIAGIVQLFYLSGRIGRYSGKTVN